MVGDTLEVTDDVKQLCNLLGVAFADVDSRELNKIGAKSVLVVVSLVFVIAYFLRDLIIVFIEETERKSKRRNTGIRSSVNCIIYWRTG